MAARMHTISGEMVTITESKGTDVAKRHWFTVSGTAQGVIDYLNEHGIPQSNVVGMAVVTTTYFILYHK